MQLIQRSPRLQVPEELFRLTESPDRVVRAFVVRALWSVYRDRGVTADWKPPMRCTILVLKSNETLQLSKYRRDGNALVFEQLDGTKGVVDMDLVDWRRTTARNQIISAD